MIFDQPMTEGVRLVVWDLDETFWRGTLTEGGIEYVQAHHDAVLELARRGIVSSICSKNDPVPVEKILREKGIWDYFVFPNIEWGSKGPRFEKLIKQLQLRAASVLFIDDNPMNRAEAVRFVGGMGVCELGDILDLLEHPLLIGRPDEIFSRLSQYKVLERRAVDVSVAMDNSAFLRDSGIKVFIDHNVEAHIDRAIELINRTNQLNYTKTRLSEDMVMARQQLGEMLRDTDIQAGIVRVVDNYGDYGYCGLYVQHFWLHDRPRLIHFCFSCRTLGMEVETWLYQKLGRPDLEICGEVLTDIKGSKISIDWIEYAKNDAALGLIPVSQKKIPRLYIKGGCETVAI